MHRHGRTDKLSASLDLDRTRRDAAAAPAPGRAKRDVFVQRLPERVARAARLRPGGARARSGPGSSHVLDRLLRPHRPVAGASGLGAARADRHRRSRTTTAAPGGPKLLPAAACDYLTGGSPPTARSPRSPAARGRAELARPRVLCRTGSRAADSPRAARSDRSPGSTRRDRCVEPHDRDPVRPDLGPVLGLWRPRRAGIARACRRYPSGALAPTSRASALATARIAPSARRGERPGREALRLLQPAEPFAIAEPQPGLRSRRWRSKPSDSASSSPARERSIGEVLARDRYRGRQLCERPRSPLQVLGPSRGRSRSAVGGWTYGTAATPPTTRYRAAAASSRKDALEVTIRHHPRVPRPLKSTPPAPAAPAAGAGEARGSARRGAPEARARAGALVAARAGTPPRVRLKDLGVTIEGPGSRSASSELYESSRRAASASSPHVWLSDEWFSPAGVPGFAIPFYLAHPRLMRLERSRCSRSRAARATSACRSCATRRATRSSTPTSSTAGARWQELFGQSSTTLPDLPPEAASKRYVQHLRLWYAQSHPDEDFAETFAVWLQPRPAGGGATRAGRRCGSSSTSTS